jgi:biotin carboxylase
MKSGMKKVALFAATTGYQVHEFAAAAEALGVELVLATDRCHILDDPWADRAAPVRFDEPQRGIEALAERGPFDGILAVGDRPAEAAAQAAVRLGLRFHPPDAVRAAGDKFETRRRFQGAGLRVPAFRLLSLASDAAEAACMAEYPCVLKPLKFSASRGVIRANNPEEFAAAFERIGAMTGDGFLLVEDFIPGREFALEGVVTGGRLQTLALFDKPDPLDGPFFEETIYLTPSRESADIQEAMQGAAQGAVAALGLTEGPMHAEVRLNREGVWMLEAAARPIGGLCARVLRFADGGGTIPFEQLLIRHALGEDISTLRTAPGAHGVMMIPIPRSGVLRGVTGVERARRTPGIEDVVITAKEGQELLALPEGSSYLGFLFARAGAPAAVESALRDAHAALEFDLIGSLPVVR